MGEDSSFSNLALGQAGLSGKDRRELAEKIANFAAATNGYITKADLAAHTSTWDEPICVSYRGYEVWEIPPNGQGIATLSALRIRLPFHSPPDISARENLI